jgi:hypothetical protein
VPDCLPKGRKTLENKESRAFCSTSNLPYFSFLAELSNIAIFSSKKCIAFLGAETGKQKSFVQPNALK